MIFLAAGAVALLTLKTAVDSEAPIQSGPGLTNFFTSDDLSYGLTGLILSIICAIMLIFFLFWHVIRITFAFDAQEGKFTVCKHGIFRKSILEFDMADISFHYFRTHFAENKRWLQFVVREGEIYFQIYSWRGKGSQTETFLNLFSQLQYHLERSQEQMLMPIHPSSKYPTEIVSKDEFTLIGPFTSRLKGFVARQRNFAAAAQQRSLKYKNLSESRLTHLGDPSQPKKKTKLSYTTSLVRSLENRGWSNDGTTDSVSSICEEQIELVDYDSLLRHFKYEKLLGGAIMPGELKNKRDDLTSAMVRKA